MRNFSQTVGLLTGALEQRTEKYEVCHGGIDNETTQLPWVARFLKKLFT